VVDEVYVWTGAWSLEVRAREPVTSGASESANETKWADANAVGLGWAWKRCLRGESLCVHSPANGGKDEGNE
jgi:hypothetical protein